MFPDKVKQIFHKFIASKDFRILFRNFTNFTLFQLTNYLVPLITIPYIIHIIGAEKFGILSFAAAVIYYFQIIIDYGFNISGVQELAVNRSDWQKVTTIYNSILSIRIMFSVIMLFLLLVASLIFIEIRLYFWVYLFGFLMIPGLALQSVWFYNRMEQMQFLNYINLISRLFYLAGILLIIKDSADFLYVPLINSLSIIVAGIVSTVVIFKKFKIRFAIPGVASMTNQLKNGWHVFISNIAMSLYRNSNVFILGLLAPKEIVGFYSAGEKVIKVLQMVFTPVTNVFYPFISRLKSEAPVKGILVLKYVIITMGSGTFILSLVLILAADWISLNFFGVAFTTSAQVIKIAAFVIFFGTLNYIIGIIFMLNFSLKREFSISVMRTGIINLIVCFVLTYSFQEIGTAYSFMFAEIFLFLNLTIYVYLKRSQWSQAGVN